MSGGCCHAFSCLVFHNLHIFALCSVKQNFSFHSFFKERFYRAKNASPKEGWSGSVKSKPPVARLAAKDTRAHLLGVCRVFLHQVRGGEAGGEPSARQEFSGAGGAGWEEVGAARGGCRLAGPPLRAPWGTRGPAAAEMACGGSHLDANRGSGDGRGWARASEGGLSVSAHSAARVV